MSAEVKVNKVGENKVMKYFRELRAEFKKITWPERKEVVNTTGIVLGTLAIFTLMIWIMDSVFGTLLRKILEYIR
ncbi:preprotein translocase subunit SecE [Caloramator sp. Dgby_cultured_2]|jgi:preprotein translocase subunit SecE|uniref:preprotein translocase subunit SecE n=1 Tax=Caloramator sp. Dgby_cultured_2 TaxID=3029174 RepID=UPI00237DD5F9|nr:preprotein translocase subunit SecE [Caloramator sp. Dgby_cultured_2]WDU83354.1 preprotein translocase subunit SecE [Caloramator sp. Dgby_cultured_2]